MKKKKFLVSKVDTDPNVTGINVDGKDMQFSNSGYSFYLQDEGVAKDIDAKYGKGSSKENRKVVISEVPMTHREGVHNYTFSIKKPKLESTGESKWIWVDDGKGKQIMVKKDASIRTA